MGDVQMNHKLFTKPSGKFVKNSDGDDAFVPNLLPPQFYVDDDINYLLIEAQTKIGELKGAGKLLENPNLINLQYSQNDAVTSSKIEGTLATIQDVLKFESIGNINKQESEHLRLNEVQNYLDALHYNLNLIYYSNESITRDMIKHAHYRLLHNIKNSDHTPGQFRTIQNWIGVPNSSIKKSVYVPPPPEYLDQLLENFESFLSNPPKNMPTLIQCAIMHYQFEAIHPFSDGNGRIGRILISLLLAEKYALPQPMLYISDYFNKNRQNYYTGLLEVTQKSKWRKWIKFFLQGIIEQADITIETIDKLVRLQKEYHNKLTQIKATANTHFILDRLFVNPYITIPQTQKFLSTSYPTAKNTIMVLVKIGALEKLLVHKGVQVFGAVNIWGIANL